MPEFVCRMGTVEGDVIERVYVSDSADVLRRDLERKDYLVFSVRKKRGALGILPAFGRKKSLTSTFSSKRIPTTNLLISLFYGMK